MKVFVVDDSAIIRDRLKRLLADAVDIQTVGESSGAHQAIAAIQEQKPDVVLLDIQLVNGNGIEVLEQVKKTQPAPAVIILTDYPYPEYRDKCIHAGADYFFVKSIEFDQVIPALNELRLKRQAGDRSEYTREQAPQSDSCSAARSTILPILMS